MAKLIRTIFANAQEAENAKEYLVSSGLSDITVNQNEMAITTNSDNWIAAYEILTSLGGSIENDTEFSEELTEYYRIQETNENNLTEDPEIDIIDDDAYIDSNLGYGDYELIEPYVLEKYGKLVEDNDKES